MLSIVRSMDAQKVYVAFRKVFPLFLTEDNQLFIQSSTFQHGVRLQQTTETQTYPYYSNVSLYSSSKEIHSGFLGIRNNL